jgi:hypothetical protein
MAKHAEKFPCTCKSKYQDEKYGEGVRLHNFARNLNQKRGGYRCTVCGKEK